MLNYLCDFFLLKKKIYSLLILIKSRKTIPLYFFWLDLGGSSLVRPVFLFYFFIFYFFYEIKTIGIQFYSWPNDCLYIYNIKI